MTHRFSLSGGLGDCIRQCFMYDGYFRLSSEERGECVIHSHNAFADELVKWHPAVIEGRWAVVKKTFDPPSHNNDELGDVVPAGYIPTFYGADKEKLARLVPEGSYVVIAPDAGNSGKSLPDEVLKEALCSYWLDLPIVLVGNTDPGAGSNIYRGKDKIFQNVIDLRNQLNVPETIEAVKNARRVYTAHSAVNIIAWFYDIPQTVCLPRQLHHDIYVSGTHTPSQHDYGMNNVCSRMIVY